MIRKSSEKVKHSIYEEPGILTHSLKGYCDCGGWAAGHVEGHAQQVAEAGHRKVGVAEGKG